MNSWNLFSRLWSKPPGMTVEAASPHLSALQSGDPATDGHSLPERPGTGDSNSIPDHVQIQVDTAALATHISSPTSVAPSAIPLVCAANGGPAEALRRVIEFDAEPSIFEPLLSGTLVAALHSRAQRILTDAEEWLAKRDLPGMAFDEWRHDARQQALVIQSLSLPSNLWFVGDLHGDLLALECCLAHIRRQDGNELGRIVFLGDLFDDGEFNYEVVLRVLELIVASPVSIGWLAGNHDEALSFIDGRFWSSVVPADFTDWLNARLDDPLARRMGKLVMQLVRQLPRALFLPDGLLVVHGGIPHRDLWGKLHTVDDLNDGPCLCDFVWTRAHERARRRIPDRTTRGCEFGREDFEEFCALAERLVGQPVRRMLRGHDHVEERYQFYELYVARPVLTINAMSHRQNRELFGRFERQPCVARWRPGELPEVHRLKIPDETIRTVYHRTLSEQVPSDDHSSEV